MILQYTVYDVELPNSEKNPYPGKLPWYRKISYIGFLKGFIHNLILFLKNLEISYPVQAAILKSAYLFESNSN